jgi:cell division protein FtsB
MRVQIPPSAHKPRLRGFLVPYVGTDFAPHAPDMIRKKISALLQKIHLDTRRAVLIGAIILLVVLMMDFNNRLSELLNLNEQKDKVIVKVTALAITARALDTQIAYATSEAAVGEWARQEGHMAKPGDIPIVPLAPVGYTPQPTPTQMMVATQVSNWEVWWAVIFGE